MIHLRVFIEIFEFQMYWMLWISEEGFSSGMNVCNISSFVTLTLCAVVGF